MLHYHHLNKFARFIFYISVSFFIISVEFPLPFPFFCNEHSISFQSSVLYAAPIILSISSGADLCLMKFHLFTITTYANLKAAAHREYNFPFSPDYFTLKITLLFAVVRNASGWTEVTTSPLS